MRLATFLLLVPLSACSGRMGEVGSTVGDGPVPAGADAGSAQDASTPGIADGGPYDGGPVVAADGGPPLPPDSGPGSAPGPVPGPSCTDTRATTPLVDGPAGLMLQTHTAGDLCLLEQSLDHVCRAHRSAATGRIDDLVLTDVVRADAAGRPTEALDTDVLALVLAHRHCFGNLFFGTIPEVVLGDPYGDDILSETSRWSWLNAARRVADALAAYLAREAPGAPWHWYASYEANLNYFVDASYRNAYVALILQHVTDLRSRHATHAVFWSPTFWTDPARLSSSARASLRAALADFFARVPGITWVAVQDHVGVSPAFDCTDALYYYDLVRAAAPGLASVQVNVEYFDLSSGGAIRPGDPAELASRIRCYRDGGARIGASFDFRYWYPVHGH